MAMSTTSMSEQTYKVSFDRVRAPISSVSEGKRPPRPKDIPDALWALVTRCWSQAPSDRPRFDAICKTLSTMYKAPRLVDKQDTILTIDTSSSSETWVTASEGGVPEEQVYAVGLINLVN